MLRLFLLLSMSALSLTLLIKDFTLDTSNPPESTSNSFETCPASDLFIPSLLPPSSISERRSAWAAHSQVVPSKFQGAVAQGGEAVPSHRQVCTPLPPDCRRLDPRFELAARRWQLAPRPVSRAGCPGRRRPSPGGNVKARTLAW